MKVLITGATGQLGTDLCKAIGDCDVVPLSHADLEITSIDDVRQACLAYRPDVIINTAAFVRVDDCEDSRDKAFQINAMGARNIAVAAREFDIKLVHISTDYVFGDTAIADGKPLTEFDPPSPVNVYGESKLAGEQYISHLCDRYFIIRTSGLFGVAGSRGKGGNFVTTIAQAACERETLTVVSDQYFSPTHALDLATKIGELIRTQYYGIFHITNRGKCSWYEFAEEIIRLTGAPAKLIAVDSGSYRSRAKRPGYSVLDNYHLRLLGMDDLPDWRQALKHYLILKGLICPAV